MCHQVATLKWPSFFGPLAISILIAAVSALNDGRDDMAQQLYTCSLLLDDLIKISPTRHF